MALRDKWRREEAQGSTLGGGNGSRRGGLNGLGSREPSSIGSPSNFATPPPARRQRPPRFGQALEGLKRTGIDDVPGEGSTVHTLSPTPVGGQAHTRGGCAGAAQFSVSHRPSSGGGALLSQRPSSRASLASERRLRDSEMRMSRVMRLGSTPEDGRRSSAGPTTPPSRISPGPRSHSSPTIGASPPESPPATLFMRAASDTAAGVACGAASGVASGVASGPWRGSETPATPVQGSTPVHGSSAPVQGSSAPVQDVMRSYAMLSTRRRLAEHAERQERQRQEVQRILEAGSPYSGRGQIKASVPRFPKPHSQPSPPSPTAVTAAPASQAAPASSPPTSPPPSSPPPSPPASSPYEQRERPPARSAHP